MVIDLNSFYILAKRLHRKFIGVKFIFNVIDATTEDNRNGILTSKYENENI